MRQYALGVCLGAGPITLLWSAVSAVAVTAGNLVGGIGLVTRSHSAQAGGSSGTSE